MCTKCIHCHESHFVCTLCLDEEHICTPVTQTVMRLVPDCCAFLVENCWLKCVLMWCVVQVHYDLGAIYFQQGSTDPSAYGKAREHFRRAKELYAKVLEHVFAGAYVALLTIGSLEI